MANTYVAHTVEGPICYILHNLAKVEMFALTIGTINRFSVDPPVLSVYKWP